MSDDATPAKVRLTAELGPLPEPRTLSRGDEDGPLQLGYTADQMRAYAAQAAQAELERLRADNAALRREAHTWWTAARDAMKLREPLAPEVIEAAAAEAFGYEGGLQEVNLGDLLHFARVLEQRHGIGA